MASRMRRPAVFAVALGFVALSAAPAIAGNGGSGDREDRTVGEGATATFEGTTLNLAESWGDATACMVWPEAVEQIECFATEAELDARIAGLEVQFGVDTKSGPTEGLLGSTQCSSYLKMYDGTWYSGSVLYLRSKYQWHNLVNYGFNQRTSSFKVGACSTYFADYNNGGGAWYPTYATQAYDQSPTMMSGWNNDVSSVYIF